MKWWVICTAIAMVLTVGIVVAIPGQQVGLAVVLGLISGCIAGWAAAELEERFG